MFLAYIITNINFLFQKTDVIDYRKKRASGWLYSAFHSINRKKNRRIQNEEMVPPAPSTKTQTKAVNREYLLSPSDKIHTINLDDSDDEDTMDVTHKLKHINIT